MNVFYRNADVDGVKVFYREAGAIDAPTVLLPHGFPASSHMYRNLIPALADRFHAVAPDLPDFGFSGAPDRAQFKYTFDNLAKVVDRFTKTAGLKRYAIYVFDYGAPVGFRLALAHPERIAALISQNGNAYIEGLSEGWNPIQEYWKEPTEANRAARRGATSSCRRQPNSDTSMASRTRRWSRRSPTCSTRHCSRGLATTRSSWTCSWITPAMSCFFQDSRNSSAPDGPASRRMWQERSVLPAAWRQSLSAR